VISPLAIAACNACSGLGVSGMPNILSAFDTGVADEYAHDRETRARHAGRAQRHLSVFAIFAYDEAIVR
jgi:hypothetical protein